MALIETVRTTWKFSFKNSYAYKLQVAQFWNSIIN